MRTSSWPSSETPVLSDAPEVDSVNVPATLPAFWMSTVPVALSPGFRFGAVRTALAAAPLPRLLSMLSVPAVKVLAGFAALAVKFAPDPTVMPTAARTTASAPTVRRGCAASADRRDTGCSSGGGGKRDTVAGVASLARTPLALQPGGAGTRACSAD